MSEPSQDAGFAEALRHAIAMRGVTLGWLHDRVRDLGTPVAISTLSQWQSGQRRPGGPDSLTVVDSIEIALGTRPGSLADLVHAPVRLGSLRPSSLTVEDEDRRRLLQETLALLGGTPLDDLRERTFHAFAQVDRTGSITSERHYLLVQALRPVTEIPGVSLVAPGAEAPAVVRTGRHPVRVVEHPSGRAIGVATALDRPMSAGETRLFESDVTRSQTDPPITLMRREVVRRTREVLLSARFSPDALPDWVEAVAVDASGRSIVVIEPDELVHASRLDFGPGVLILRWGSGEPVEGL